MTDRGKAKDFPRRGEIWQVDLNPTSAPESQQVPRNREITKKRPALVISDDDYNENTNYVCVIPITNTIDQERFRPEIEVMVPAGKNVTGKLLVIQQRSVDRHDRLKERLDKLDIVTMAAVEKILKSLLRLK